MLRFPIGIFLVFFFVLKPARAEFSPIGLSLFPNFQFPSEEGTVMGLRANLSWSVTKSVYGLDVGLLGNVTSEHFIGSSVALGFNRVRDAVVIGGMVAGGANIVKGSAIVYGVQAAAGWNTGRTSVYGVQVAAINFADRVNGCQVGLLNRAETIVGLQIGLLNSAKSLSGLQIGLWNKAGNADFKALPFVNAAF
jgi:hypothetical protein